jgi:hypothetical protein
MMEVAVPMIALAPPVIGSMGPSSIANSRARYLRLLDAPNGLLFCYLQLQLGEIDLSLLSKYRRGLRAQLHLRPLDSPDCGPARSYGAP